MFAQRAGKDGPDFFASQVCESNMLQRESLLQLALLRGGRCLNSVVKRLPEPARIRVSGAITRRHGVSTAPDGRSEKSVTIHRIGTVSKLRFTLPDGDTIGRQ